MNQKKSSRLPTDQQRSILAIAGLGDPGMSAAQVKAAYLIQWLSRQGYNANQRAEITDVFTTWQMIAIDKPSKKATAFVNANPMP